MTAIATISSAAFENGHWRPGVGDATAMGWITTVGYILASLLCLWTALRCRSEYLPSDTAKPGSFWLILGVTMLVLAVNKQLDLQMWFWQTGKEYAKSHNLYDHRKVIQFGSMAVITLGAGAIFWYFRRLTRGSYPEYALALFGVLFTLCFVIIRAGSLHHVDLILGWHLGMVKINWILENGGILMVGVAAARTLRRLGPRHFVQFGDRSLLDGSREKLGNPPPTSEFRKNEHPKN